MTPRREKPNISIVYKPGSNRADRGLAHSTVVVVGAGFTGIEVATEMPAKLDRAQLSGQRRIVLVDPNANVGIAERHEFHEVVAADAAPLNARMIA
jgi:NADH dehydrogenase FAD-containing subunit